VDSVLANGRVYWAGVLEGDLLTRINDVRLDDPRTFQQAVRLVEDQFLRGRPERIHLIRQGKAAALLPMGAIKSEPVPPIETQP
jgi:S1-C subfamily serine protease